MITENNILLFDDEFKLLTGHRCGICNWKHQLIAQVRFCLSSVITTPAQGFDMPASGDRILTNQQVQNKAEEGRDVVPKLVKEEEKEEERTKPWAVGLAVR